MVIGDREYDVQLVDLIAQLNIDLQANRKPILDKIKPTTDNVQMCCPFHHERKPSFGINKVTGVYNCLNPDCGAKGTMDVLIDKLFGKSNFASSWLKSHWSSHYVGRAYKPKDTDSKPIDYIDDSTLQSYRGWELPYMLNRKLTYKTLDYFDIGYDASKQHITFPHYDVEGRCECVCSRDTRSKYFHIPTGIDKPLYGLYELCKYEQDHPDEIQNIIICESAIDALTCWEYGKFAVATDGKVSPKQLKQLKQFDKHIRFVLATDMDRAGISMREMYRKELRGYTVLELIWDGNVYKDINDMDKHTFDNLKYGRAKLRQELIRQRRINHEC